MDILSLALKLCLPLLPSIVVLLVVTMMERRWPAVLSERPDEFQNMKVYLASFVVQALAIPALGGLTTLAVNAAGGGLIQLPSSGWGLMWGAAVYLIAMDFGEWSFHRAQHAIPFMWEMHSLHHSDTNFDATTTVRHFWLDPLMKTVTIWLVVGLLFNAGPAIVIIYTLALLYNFVTHSNLKLSFGKAWWVWNSPQYHRIHHSASPEHFDVNYAALLPVFDLIAGTYYRPRANEYPQTGLDTGDEPKSFLEAIAWPLRKLKVGERLLGKTAQPAAR